MANRTSARGEGARPPAALLFLLLSATFLAGCDSGASGAADAVLPDDTVAAVQTYAEIVLAAYRDSLLSARDLDEAVRAFVAAPGEESLQAARRAWLDAREPYLQTEVFRFYDGPIDRPGDGPEGMINAWPLDEAYIDGVVDDPDAGIVNDLTVEIRPETLEALNEQGGEENVATGWHAIEFLLWGQDLSADGPGARPFTDYVEGGTAPHPQRRGAYLTTVSAMLVEDLEGLVGEWETTAGDNYRAEFLAAPQREALRRILTGMIVLSGFETGGERLQTALDSGDQEDEHSCFSDNTHRDMVQNIVGIRNVWVGSYGRIDGSTVSGTGVAEVVSAVDEELAGELDRRIDESLRLARALEPPFDREIAPGNAEGRRRVQELVTSLRTLERRLQQVFRLLDLTIPAPQ